MDMFNALRQKTFICKVPFLKREEIRKIQLEVHQRADKEEFELKVNHNPVILQTWNIKNRSKMTKLIE